MSMKSGTILLSACAMLAGVSALSSPAHAQAFQFFFPPIFEAPPPPEPFYGRDFYDEAEPYYDQGPRHYRPEPRRRPRHAPAPRPRKPKATVERRAPAPHKPRAAALALPPKPEPPKAVRPKAALPPKAAAISAACEKAQSSVAGFGFKEITPQSCSGKTLNFSAVRDGKRFQIQVLAESGELTKVQRMK